MKRFLKVLLALSLSACGTHSPQAKRYDQADQHNILGKNWSVSCSIIQNAMPGSNNSLYGIVSLYSRDDRMVFSSLKLEKVWFYQKDSLMSSWDEFDDNWLNPNGNRLNYYCRKVGKESFMPCDKAVIRFRSIYGRAYTVAVPAPKISTVH